MIGADETSVNNWETNKAAPSIAFMPGIIAFLKYVPYGTYKNLGEKIRAARESFGLSQELLARRLEIDPTTLRRWEGGKSRPSKALFEKLDRLFNSLPSTGEEPGQ